MTDRIMMYLAGRTRPLTFDRNTGAPPLLASSETSWAGPPVELHSLRTVDYVGPSGPLDGECGLFVVLEGGVEIVVRRANGTTLRRMNPGYTAFLSGAERPTVVRMSGSAKIAAVHVPPEWFARLSIENTPRTFGRTKPLTRDETIVRLVSAICDEIARGAPTGRLYAESLSMALLSYALRHLSAPHESGAQGALSDGQCRRLRAYIRERLEEDLSVDELSRAVGLGPRHFSRVFRSAFGITPHQYVMRERLSEGARLLERGGHDVSDVALSVGFSNQSHFTCAFRRAFGVTPNRYARSKRTAWRAFE